MYKNLGWEFMDWFKKHADAVGVIVVIFGSMVWMNGKFNTLEKDMAIMKTVMIMKGILPDVLAKAQVKND